MLVVGELHKVAVFGLFDLGGGFWGWSWLGMPSDLLFVGLFGLFGSSFSNGGLSRMRWLTGFALIGGFAS